MNEKAATLQQVGDKIEIAKKWYDKASGLWKGAKKAVQSDVAAVVAGTGDVLLATVGVPPLMTISRQKMLEIAGDSGHIGDGSSTGGSAQDSKTARPRKQKPMIRASIQRRQNSNKQPGRTATTGSVSAVCTSF